MTSTFANLMGGFETALLPFNLLMALVGTLLGTAIGVLPGIGPALTIALLLPVTFQLAPETAFIMFAGILYGAMYGGYNVYSAEHARRKQFHRHSDRRQPYGAERARRRSASDRRDWLVCRGHDRNSTPDLSRTDLR